MFILINNWRERKPVCYSCKNLYKEMNLMVITTFISVWLYYFHYLLFMIVIILFFKKFKLNFIIGKSMQKKIQYIRNLVLSTVLGIHWGYQNISHANRVYVSVCMCAHFKKVSNHFKYLKNCLRILVVIGNLTVHVKTDTLPWLTSFQN